MSNLSGVQDQVPGDPTAFYELSLAEQWGDGAPVLAPTDAAIEALLAWTPDPADHVVGVLPHDKPAGFWKRMSRGVTRLASWVNPFR